MRNYSYPQLLESDTLVISLEDDSMELDPLSNVISLDEIAKELDKRLDELFRELVEEVQATRSIAERIKAALGYMLLFLLFNFSIELSFWISNV